MSHPDSVLDLNDPAKPNRILEQKLHLNRQKCVLGAKFHHGRVCFVLLLCLLSSPSRKWPRSNVKIVMTGQVRCLFQVCPPWVNVEFFSSQIMTAVRASLLSPTKQNNHACPLSGCRAAWQNKCTINSWLRCLIQNGYTLHFARTPPRFN